MVSRQCSASTVDGVSRVRCWYVSVEVWLKIGIAEQGMCEIVVLPGNFQLYPVGAPCGIFSI